MRGALPAAVPSLRGGAPGEGDGVVPPCSADLPIDVRHVPLDGRHTQHQLRRDLLVRLAVGDSFQHLHLARAQSGGVLTPVIRSVQCEYHAPAYMDDLLAITVLVPRVSLATLSLRYLCRREEKLLALGHVTFAFVDVRGKPNRVPPDLRRAIDDCPALQPATSG